MMETTLFINGVRLGTVLRADIIKPVYVDSRVLGHKVMIGESVRPLVRQKPQQSK